MLEVKTRQKIKSSTRFWIVGYLIACLIGCIGSYLVFLCLWSLYGVPHMMFALLAISSGGIMSFILTIFSIGRILEKYLD
ncbi:hypothetical protein [Lysinibacillus parviboronicapiens]|uniref:Flippase GtrA n=1 Tax=Lysinibacillus parviboronicapiens TaxID=436516 RepID=A0ABV2PK78_9BACI|nr:hypothetical protein [Lysinibacillus parviboronicapiens]